MSPSRLFVVGPGAIGGGLAGLLARVDKPVELVTRRGSADHLRQRGLTIRRPDEAYTLALPVHDGIESVDWREGDTALVATKLYDAEAAYDALLEAAGPRLPVVAAQNGMIGDDWARERFETVVPTMVWLAAECMELGEVHLHAEPIPGLVDVPPEGAWLARWLREAGVTSTVREDLDAWKRAKWMTNLCGAAIVFDHADWVPELMAEGRAALEAAGLDAVPESVLFDYVGELSLAPIDGRDRMPGGSTAQSHARGRPLEIPWLNGPIVDLAHRHGVPVPRNGAVLAWASR